MHISLWISNPRGKPGDSDSYFWPRQETWKGRSNTPCSIYPDWALTAFDRQYCTYQGNSDSHYFSLSESPGFDRGHPLRNRTDMCISLSSLCITSPPIDTVVSASGKRTRSGIKFINEWVYFWIGMSPLPLWWSRYLHPCKTVTGWIIEFGESRLISCEFLKCWFMYILYKPVYLLTCIMTCICLQR